MEVLTIISLLCPLVNLFRTQETRCKWSVLPKTPTRYGWRSLITLQLLSLSGIRVSEASYGY